MKKILIFTALIGCVILGCKKKETVSQAGVYRLDKQVASGGGKDTIYRRTQMKVYTDRYFIWEGTKRVALSISDKPLENIRKSGRGGLDRARDGIQGGIDHLGQRLALGAHAGL